MMRRSPRALVLWACAVVVAVGTAAVVASDLATLHRRASDLGPERQVLVARRALRVGTVVTDGDLRERPVHAAQLPPGVIARPDDALGRVVRVPVVAGGFVATDNLAPRTRSGLEGVVPAGSRAMRVVVVDSIRPRPGDAVDVLASFEAVDEPGASGVAVVVAGGVLVVDVDDARTAEGAAGLGVTVLVSPREARELAFAATHGAVAIALVPPEEARGTGS
jgi:Flp pilus assembly protein CpaB